MIVRFLNESSQMRKRAYTCEPEKRTDTIVNVGRWFVIVTAGATIAVRAEVAVAALGVLRCHPDAEPVAENALPTLSLLKG